MKVSRRINPSKSTNINRWSYFLIYDCFSFNAQVFMINSLFIAFGYSRLKLQQTERNWVYSNIAHNICLVLRHL